MTDAAWILLALAALFAVGDWVSRAVDHRLLEYVCKPAALALLVLVAVVLDPANGAQRAWFVAALVFSLAGDVLLMLPSDRFVAGLASFLVAHLCYIPGLLLERPTLGAFVIAAVVVVLAVGWLGREVIAGIRRRRDNRLVAPVAAYIGVISVMWTAALASGDAWAAAGATLFVVSDSMIAWNRFVRPFGAAALLIMVTYHLGQAGLVLSLT